jgi:hypothetical protein
MTWHKWAFDNTSGNFVNPTYSDIGTKSLGQDGSGTVPFYQNTAPYPQVGAGYLNIPSTRYLLFNADYEGSYTDGATHDAYFYLPTLPTGGTATVWLFCGFYYNPVGVAVTSDGRLALKGPSSIHSQSAAGLVVAGQWFRVSVKLDPTLNGGTGGYRDAKLFTQDTLDSSTPTWVSTGSTTTYGGYMATNYQPTVPLYIDNYVFSDTLADGDYDRTRKASATFEGTVGDDPSNMTGTLGTSTQFQVDTTMMALSSTQKLTGTTSARVTNLADEANFAYTPPDTLTEAPPTSYFRGYFYLTAAPALDFALALAWGTGFLNMNAFVVTSTRKFAGTANSTRTAAGYGTSNVETATNTVPLNEWFRVEVKLTTTAVQGKVWTTSGAGVQSTGSPDFSLNTTPTTSIGQPVGTYFGYGSAIASGGGLYAGGIASGQYMYMDEFALSTSDWVGPIAAASSTYKLGPGIGRY